jgi:hypothetical protein
MQFRMQTLLTDGDYRGRSGRGREMAGCLAEVIQQMRENGLMYRHDPRGLAYEAWSLETFGEEKHRKKAPKEKKEARQGRQA